MQLQEHGRIKYGAEDLLASSAGLGWRGIAAEHRRHPKGLLPTFQPQHMEIGIATASHPDCVVSRTGDRLRQHTRVEPGTIWLCPVGVLEEDIDISAWHDVLHVYMPPERFAQLSEVRGGAASRPDAVRYLGGIYDERVRRMGIGLLRELRAPSSAGTMLLDMLTLRLTEWLVDSHSSHVGRATRRSDRLLLDDRRLRRVLDYMAAHLETDVSLDDLAQVANLSPFHFSRVFAAAMGMPPHRYLSRLRLERAKTLLALGAMSITEIALTCFFPRSRTLHGPSRGPRGRPHWPTLPTRGLFIKKPTHGPSKI